MGKTRFARFILFALSAVFFACTYASAQESNDQYNVVLISIDTLRADHLGCYGYDRNTSPNIDAIAKKSIVFENAYSQAPNTTPSHMTMFTSLYPAVHDIAHPCVLKIFFPDNDEHALSPRITVLTEILKREGYATGAFTGNGAVHSKYGFGRGFDHYGHRDPVAYICNVTKEERAAPMEWIRNNTQQPFFLFVHTYAVHFPYLSPEYKRFIDPLHHTTIPSSYEEWFIWSNQKKVRQKDIDLHKAYFDTVNTDNKKDIQHLIDLYDGCIYYADAYIGELYQQLKELGVLNHTMLIITADHGEAFFEHEMLGHHTFNREVLHVPFIVFFPKCKPQRVRHDARLIDLMPTILNYIGISFQPKGYDLQGKPLLSNNGDVVNNNEQIFADMAITDDIGYKNGDWWYVSQWHSMAKLYYSVDDYYQEHDRASEYPEIYQEMKNACNLYFEHNRALSKQLNKDREEIDHDDATVQKLRALGYIS